MKRFTLLPIADPAKDAAALRFPCASCGAQVGEKCETNAGALRDGTHVSRRLDVRAS